MPKSDSNTKTSKKPLKVGPKLKKRAAWIAAALEELYPTVQPPLNHFDPFTLLVAVLLSAQTTDKKVNEVTPALFAVGGTPLAMSALGSERILEIIRPLGLAPQKAKHLERMSKILWEKYQGQVPQDLELLKELPGVGHKTASVVMHQAFGEATFPVDTHIHRLAQRWGLSDGHSVERTESDLKRLFPRDLWGKLHLQIIFYGRQYCQAVRHELANCPICRYCGIKSA